MPTESRKPENSQTCLYIPIPKSDATPFAEIQAAIEAHFGAGSDLKDFNIEFLEFHARHIGYDLYDSADYDHYFMIERI